jgi:hypothetical protein
MKRCLFCPTDFPHSLLTLRFLFCSNYEQLGLKFRLFSAEVLFNRGLAHIYLGRMDEGLADMREAKAVAVTPDHGVIADAISDRGEGYTVFSIVSHLPPQKRIFAQPSGTASGGPVPPRREETSQYEDERFHRQSRACLLFNRSACRLSSLVRRNL